MGFSVNTWKLECNIVNGGYTKKNDKNNKKLQVEFEEIVLTTLPERRIRDDLIETFKIINRILIIVDIFSTFLLKLEIYCQERFQKRNLLTN